jgi:hypothetical protein
MDSFHASSFSFASREEQKSQEHCGATMSYFIMRYNVKHICEHDLPIAINNNLRGQIMLTTLSICLKILIIISSSVSGAGWIQDE